MVLFAIYMFLRGEVREMEMRGGGRGGEERRRGGEEASRRCPMPARPPHATQAPAVLVPQTTLKPLSLTKETDKGTIENERNLVDIMLMAIMIGTVYTTLFQTDSPLSSVQ